MSKGGRKGDTNRRGTEWGGRNGSRKVGDPRSVSLGTGNRDTTSSLKLASDVLFW